MTREQLRAWLTGLASVLNGVAAWMAFVNFGPIAFVRPYLARAGAFCTAVAGSDAVLDAIIGSGVAAGLHLASTPHPDTHQLAMLHSPTEAHKEQFISAVSGEDMA